MKQTVLSLKIGGIILLVLLSNKSISQTSKIDSLKALLESDLENQNIYLQFELAREYMDVDNASAFEYASRAFLNAREAADTLMLVKAGRIKAQILRRLGKMDSAVILFHEVLPIASRNNFKGEIKYILNGLSVAYLGNRNYDKALRHLFEFLQFKEVENDKFWKGIALSNVGLIYYNLKDYDKAIFYYSKALPIKADAHDQTGINITLANISLCLAYKGVFNEARNLVDQVFSKCNIGCSDDMTTTLFANLGIIDFLEGKYSEAECALMKSYYLAVASKDLPMALDILNYLVRISVRTNNVERAENYFKEYESLLDSGVSYVPEVLRAYFEFSLLHRKLNNLERALTYQHKYIVLSDSLFNEQLTTNLMSIEAAHLERENNDKIEAQAKILALNEGIISRQRYLNLSIGMVALLLICFAILLIKSNRQRQRMNKLLDRKVKQRTEELEVNRDELIRAVEERNVLVYSAASDIRSLVATIKGLCLIGLKDCNDTSEYFLKVNMTSDNFSEVVNKLMNNNNSK